MAWYTDSSRLVQCMPSHDRWTTVYAPGDTVPTAGIYVCLGCRREVSSSQSTPFPAHDHHIHAPHQGPIRWQLAVRTNTRGY